MQFEATKAISMLMATRGRPELAFKSLKSLIDNANDVNEIEFCIAIDNDDTEVLITLQKLWFLGFNKKNTIYW